MRSKHNLIFPGSAAVAQLAVNQLVVGSNPTPGASQNNCSLKAPYHTVFLVYIRGFFVLIQGSEIRNSTIGVFLVVQNFQISQTLFERGLTLCLR